MSSEFPFELFPELSVNDNQNKSKKIVRKQNICKAFFIESNKIKKCENSCQKSKYCSSHENKYRLEKPKDCAICLEEIHNSHDMTQCNHLNRS